VTLNLLATVQAELDGDLDRVVRMFKVKKQRLYMCLFQLVARSLVEKALCFGLMF
jgi:hypothetical protein